MLLACLNCGGTGVSKAYLNVSGDYRWYHCPYCEGTGKHEYAKLVTKSDVS